MKHLLEASKALEVRRAALALQSRVIEQTDGKVTVELDIIHPQSAPVLKLNVDGVVMTFVSDITKAQAMCVIGIDDEHLQEPIIWVMHSANMITPAEMLTSGQYTTRNLRHLDEVVAYILSICFAASLGGIRRYSLDNVKNRKLMINDGHKCSLLKSMVLNKRLELGEYGAFVDSKIALKAGKSSIPNMLYRYRIEAITTSVGVEYPSVKAMMDRYKAEQIHELWAGIELKAYSYYGKRVETLGWGHYAFYSVDGFPLKFFTVEEVA